MVADTEGVSRNQTMNPNAYRSHKPRPVPTRHRSLQHLTVSSLGAAFSKRLHPVVSLCLVLMVSAALVSVIAERLNHF